MLRESLFSLKSFLFRNQAEDLMDSEVRYHIERETAEYIGKGLSPAEARRQAMLAFGGIDKTEEECRDAWGIRRLEDLRADIIFSLRSLRKHSGYTLAAVLTLALGIGCNTALFSVLRSVVFRPLPMRDGDRAVTLRRINTKTGQPTFGFSVPEMEQYRAQAKTLDGLVEFHMMTFTLLGRVEPENVETAVVSAGYFDFFGIQPLHGRGFQTGEDQHGATPVLVLSHRYFVKSFGANPDIVGTTVRMNDRVHTIVGILPPLPEFPAPIDVYMPASSCPTRSNPKFEQNRRAGLLQLYGRIRPGSSLPQVQSEYESILDRYKAENPDVYPAGLQWAPKATLLKDEMVRQARPTLWFLFAITGLVLLIACASVANLSLARALRREREVAIRAALGASRGRLLHQFVVEGLLISLVGGLLGLASAHAALDLLARFVQRFSVRADEIQIDLPVLLFLLESPSSPASSSARCRLGEPASILSPPPRKLEPHPRRASTSSVSAEFWSAPKSLSPWSYSSPPDCFSAASSNCSMSTSASSRNRSSASTLSAIGPTPIPMRITSPFSTAF